MHTGPGERAPPRPGPPHATGRPLTPFPAAYVFTCMHLYAPVFTIEKQNRWCVEGMEKTHRAVMLSQGTGAAQNSLSEAREGLRRPPEAPGASEGPGGPPEALVGGRKAPGGHRRPREAPAARVGPT